MPKSVARTGFSEKFFVRGAQSFGHADGAPADALHGALDALDELRFVERNFREQQNLRRLIGVFRSEAASRGDPASVAAHHFEHEHLRGR